MTLRPLVVPERSEGATMGLWVINYVDPSVLRFNLYIDVDSEVSAILF